MLHISNAKDCDKLFWFTLDTHLSEAEYIRKIRDRRAYILRNEDQPIGVMRYNLFWDIIPFLTFIYVDQTFQGKGFGRRAMAFWEAEMRQLGYDMVMTSTQVDEDAQYFYRKLGYRDKGSLFFDGTPIAQAQELILIKVL